MLPHSIKIYVICIGCAKCPRACPINVFEMIFWDGCKTKQIAFTPMIENCLVVRDVNRMFNEFFLVLDFIYDMKQLAVWV